MKVVVVVVVVAVGLTTTMMMTMVEVEVQMEARLGGEEMDGTWKTSGGAFKSREVGEKRGTSRPSLRKSSRVEEKRRAGGAT